MNFAFKRREKRPHHTAGSISRGKIILLLLLLTGTGIIGAFAKHKLFPPLRRPVILTLQTWPISAEEIAFFKKVRPYGFILFEYSFRGGINPPMLKRTLAKELNRDDIYFFIDQEGGKVDRLKGFPPFQPQPAANSFEKLSDGQNPQQAVLAAYNAGYMAGQHAREQAFDVNLAPAAELCHKNGFLDSRCFSANPKIVSLLANAFAEGVHAAGIEPAFKHAPGIAYAGSDPHTRQVTVNRTLEELKTNELKAMEHAGRWTYLLIGHAVYPAIDPDTLSTYSPKFYQFVRQELNFHGLIITDALNMKSANPQQFSRGKQMLLALNAGADIVTPFFSNQDSFEQQWQEIQKIPKEHIRRFNKRLKKLHK